MTPIIATLAYVVSPDRSRVLLLRRDKRPDDMHAGMHVGLGGKINPDEDVLTSVRREVREESGLAALDTVLRGTMSWPGFGRDGQDWFGFIFRVDSFTGTQHAGNHEGTLVWVERDHLLTTRMWSTDYEWLPMVFDDDPRPFHGVAPYANGVALRSSYARA